MVCSFKSAVLVVLLTFNLAIAKRVIAEGDDESFADLYVSEESIRADTQSRKMIQRIKAHQGSEKQRQQSVLEIAAGLPPVGLPSVLDPSPFVNGVSSLLQTNEKKQQIYDALDKAHHASEKQEIAAGLPPVGLPSVLDPSPLVNGEAEVPFFGDDTPDVNSSVTGVLVDKGVSGMFIQSHAHGVFDCQETVKFEPGIALKEIGSKAFKGCKALKTIEIPKSVEVIHEKAFWIVGGWDPCGAGLETVTFEPGSALKEIGAWAFHGCKALKTIEIPKSVEVIHEKAFFGAGLETVTFEEGSALKEIGAWAFKQCKALNIKVPKSVEVIGEQAFAEAWLETVTFEPGGALKEMGKFAFYSCRALKTIEIPMTAKDNIGSAAFAKCVSLEEIRVPKKMFGFFMQTKLLYHSFQQAIGWDWSFLNRIGVTSKVKFTSY